MFANDVFGSCLLSFLSGNRNATIRVHSPGFDDDEILASYLCRNFDQLPEWEKVALSHCKSKTLDVGSCSGTHSNILQNKLGIDVTSLEMDAAACQFQKENYGLTKIEQQDFWEYTSQEKYDSILLLMNGIGIAGQVAKFADFVTHSFSLLNEGGKIIFESCDVAYLFPENELPKEPYYGELQYQISFGEDISAPFNWLYLDPKLFLEIATSKGWKAKVVYQGEDDNYIGIIEK